MAYSWPNSGLVLVKMSSSVVWVELIRLGGRWSPLWLLVGVHLCLSSLKKPWNKLVSSIWSWGAFLVDGWSKICAGVWVSPSWSSTRMWLRLPAFDGLVSSTVAEWSGVQYWCCRNNGVKAAVPMVNKNPSQVLIGLHKLTADFKKCCH